MQNVEMDEELLQQLRTQQRLRRKDQMLDIVFPILAVFGFLVLWFFLVYFFRIPEFLVPSPVGVVLEIKLKLSELMQHSLITSYESIIGFIAAITIGFPAALLIVWSKSIERAIMPLLVFSQTLPKVAIAPLLLVWFGFGIVPKLIIAFLIAFFPIVVSTTTGLKSVEVEMLELMRSMSATRWQEFTKARIPNSLPYLFSGLKVAVILAVIGAIVGEFVGADRGLGYLVVVTSGNLDTKLLFASIIFLSVLGFILFLVVDQLEKVFLPWHVSMRKEEVVAEISY